MTKLVFSRLPWERHAPQSEHTVSTLAAGLLWDFPHLLSEGQTCPFPHAMVKITEAKQDFKFLKSLKAVAEILKLNLWELITLCTLKFLRDCVFLCIYIIASLVQQLHLILIWGPTTNKGVFLNIALFVCLLAFCLWLFYLRKLKEGEK